MGEDHRAASETSRYTVEEAAAVLGMTIGAVRNRLSKGILRSVEERGTVYVLLPAYLSRYAPHDTGDIPGTPGVLMSEMRARIAFLERELEGSSALVSELRERIALLEREIAGKDAILRDVAEAVKDSLPPTQEEGPSRARGPSEAPTERLRRVEPQPVDKGAQEPAEPRSWWRRMFGG